MNKNVERGQATRAHLVEVATRLFAAHGYDGTSIEAALAGSGVSRGSLYHHFPGKDALFWAVMEEVGARISGPVAEAMRDAPDPVAALRAGCLAWIRLGRDPGGPPNLLVAAPAGRGRAGSRSFGPAWWARGAPCSGHRRGQPAVPQLGHPLAG